MQLLSNFVVKQKVKDSCTECNASMNILVRFGYDKKFQLCHQCLVFALKFLDEWNDKLLND